MNLEFPGGETPRSRRQGISASRVDYPPWGIPIGKGWVTDGSLRSAGLPKHPAQSASP